MTVLVNAGNGFYNFHADGMRHPAVVYRRYSGAWRVLYPAPERGQSNHGSLREAKIALYAWAAAKGIR